MLSRIFHYLKHRREAKIKLRILDYLTRNPNYSAPAFAIQAQIESMFKYVTGQQEKR